MISWGGKVFAIKKWGLSNLRFLSGAYWFFRAFEWFLLGDVVASGWLVFVFFSAGS